MRDETRTDNGESERTREMKYETRRNRGRRECTEVSEWTKGVSKKPWLQANTKKKQMHR